MNSDASISGGVPYVTLQRLKKQYAISFVLIVPSSRIHVCQSVALDGLISDVKPSSLSSIAKWLCNARASLRMVFGPQSPTAKRSSRA